MKSIILSLLLMAVLLSGCVIFEEEVVVNETEEAPPPPPPKTPVISISNPGDGELIIVSADGGQADLLLTSQNLILRPAGGTKKVGEGHFVITVNGESNEFSGKLYSIPVTPGEYTVDVELRHNDRTSYSPRIAKTVSFTVEADEPEVYVPESHTVKINDFSYSPEELTVKVTDTVTFVNEGSFPRSATCFIGGREIFDTGVIGPGAEATITANEVADCAYYATTHRAMTGRLVAESNGMETVKTVGSQEGCGEDLDCFIEASEDCSPAEVLYTADAVFQKTTSTMRIEGSEGNKCILYIKRDKIENTFEVSPEEQAAYDASIGNDGTCEFEGTSLTDMLERWKSGSFSLSDWEDKGCTGSYFNN